MTKPKWTAVKIKLGQIQAWDNNPRMSTKAQAQRIIASERKFGQPVPFLVAPEVDGRFLLYDGHQRLAAWFTVYGADYEMDAMKADRPLTEAEHKELIITLHTGATGSWDWNALSGWSAGDLQEWGMNADALKGWNNDANNLREMMTAGISEEEGFGGLDTEDRAPFRQVTFTLHDSQYEQISEALRMAKAAGAFVDSPNENSNGNALARICKTYITEHDNS